MALTDNLVAWWRLDEASGSRADSSGNGFTLTDNNTVGSATGLVSALAADFIPANSESLSTANATVNGTIVSATSWTLALWIYPEYDGVNRLAPVGNLDGAFSGILMLQKTTPTDGNRRASWQVWHNGGGVVGVEPPADAAVNTWSFVVLKWDTATGKLYARTNATTTSGTTWTDTLSANAILYLGRRGSSLSGIGDYWDGRIGPVGLWSRALTGAELDTLYNSGAGLDPTISGQPAAARGVLVPGMNRDGRHFGAARIGWG